MTTAPTSGGGRSYLWLTRFYPYPAYAGDRIYTARLIESLAAQDCAITVLCTIEAGGDEMLPPEGPARRVEWVRVPAGSAKRMWTYPISSLPRQALALAAPAQRAAAERLFRRQHWDAVLVDYVTMGWVLPLVEACWPNRAERPALVYISHNHEASLRRAVIQEAAGSALKRLAQRMDARRIIALERRLVTAAALVTANTETDRNLYRRDAPDRHCTVLAPGYDGPMMTERVLSLSTPRRVVVVGSFDWILKRQNLLEFLKAAVGPLGTHGIGIDIVGRGPESFLTMLRRRFLGVAIHGLVERVEPYLQAARISVVPERVGGGFKHKTLNAIFQRTPVFALSGSVAGLPPGAVRFCDGFNSLVQEIVNSIDDLDGLNALQQEAFAACKSRFDWLDRGRILHLAIDGLGMAPTVPPPDREQCLAGQVFP